jgi:hypothetical protein
MLSSGSGDQLCSPLVALLWRWLFSVLVYWDFHVGGLFLCPALFLWGRFSVPSAPSAVSVLWWFTICFSILWVSLTLDAAHWCRRWALLSATWSDLRSGLLLTCSWPSCLSSVCLLIVRAEIISLPLSLSVVHFQRSHPLCCCARLQFAVCYSGFFGGGVSLPWGCADLSQERLGEFCTSCGAHLFVLSNVSQAALEMATAAATKFSECNMLWGSFP